jgi:tRNA nucleotidyltransferase (CCA-adding enzyme)
LGKDIFDLDIVVEGDAIMFAQKVAEYLKKEFRRHRAFGTATVHFDEYRIDFATARKELYPSFGALPTVKPANLREDLFRRDFTINTMAISLNRDDYGKIIDFYNGISDLRKGLIRILHKDSFLEDPTRILRAVRFEQRLSFKIEKNTFELMVGAINVEALKLVHPHRLRDELFLVLKEPRPYRCIKRIEQLMGFSFINSKIKFTADDCGLFLRIEEAVSFYKNKFKKHRRLEEWLIYLMAILIKLSSKDLLSFFNIFGLRKGERIRIISAKNNLSKIKNLNKHLKPHAIYRIVDHLSFESILFFYAYYSKNKIIKNNIEYFLDKLVHTRLKVKGEDLKSLGIKPLSLYGKILNKLLDSKMDNCLKNKQEEIKEAISIFEQVSKLHPKSLHKADC